MVSIPHSGEPRGDQIALVRFSNGGFIAVLTDHEGAITEDVRDCLLVNRVRFDEGKARVRFETCQPGNEFLQDWSCPRSAHT
jgi:hypothetical protein